VFIRSERLFLRPTWPEDWSELHSLINDEALARHLARVPWPYSADDARAYVGMPQAPRHPHFLITLPDLHGADGGARVIGAVGFADCEGQAELGYWIAREHWNRGYGTEAARAALTLARALGHCRIVSSHFVDNAASGRVLAKLGFVPTGQARLRHSPARGRADLTLGYALELCPSASDPADPDDPAMLKRAA